MSKALRRFSWGFLLVLLDFEIGGFDLTVDLIGFVLMRSAIVHLGTTRADYLKAKPYAVILAVLSVVNIVAPFFSNPSVQPNDEVHIFALAYGSIMMVLTLLLMERFLNALKHHAADVGLHVLAKEVNGRWLFYAITMIAHFLLFPFQINLSSPMIYVLIYILVGLLAIVASLLVFILCRRAANQFEPKPSIRDRVSL